MDPSRESLARFVTDGSEAAFREVVSRHVNLVYGVAMRRTGGDVEAAREVVQVVFADLARKAGSLPKGTILSGWLYRHTGFVAAKWIRSEHRRRRREHAAAMEQDIQSTPDPVLWDQVAPLLDEVLEKLPEEDRDAVVLRYLEGRGLREVGGALGISEDAARMRISRALEKLRQALSKRGISTTGMALGGALLLASKAEAPLTWVAPLAQAAVKSVPAVTAAGAAGGGMAAWLGKGALAMVTIGVVWVVWQKPDDPAGPPPEDKPARVDPAWKVKSAKAEDPSGWVEMLADSPADVITPADVQVVEKTIPVPVLVPAASTVLPAPAPAPVPAPEPAAELQTGLTKLMLGVVPAAMKFDKAILRVKAGVRVMLLYKNDRCPLQHNFLLIKPGTLETVGALADQMLSDPNAIAKFYIPHSADILASGKRLIGIGQSDLIDFTAPEEPGDYPYVCTFPGHWRMMHGILRVEP